MEKLGISPIKRLDQLRTSSGSAKASSSSSQQFQHSESPGNNLEPTAEKLVTDQASMETDVQMVNSKLENSVRSLEDKLQNACNDYAKLMATKQEHEKLLRRLESEFSSTKIMCDQLTETLQQLASHLEDAEKLKSLFESKISKSSEAIDFLNQQVHDLSIRLSSAEEHIKIRDKELEELKCQQELKEKLYLEEQRRTASKNLVYIDTSFGTCVAMVVRAHESVFDVKEKLRIAYEHHYPEHGNVQISRLKVKRRGSFFALADSMLMFKIFYHVKSKEWFMSADFIKESEDCPVLKEAPKAKVDESKTKKQKLKHSGAKKSRKKKSSRDINVQADAASYGTKENEKEEKNPNSAGSGEDVPKAADTIQPTITDMEQVDTEKRREIREGKRVANETETETTLGLDLVNAWNMIMFQDVYADPPS